MLNKKIEYFVTLAECLSFYPSRRSPLRVSNCHQPVHRFPWKPSCRCGCSTATPMPSPLTDAGKFFYERVTFMLRYESDTKKRLIAIAEQYSGYVKVGIGMYESRHTEDFFSRFLLSHPEIKVDIFQYPYGALTEKLKSGELDVILANVLCEKAFAKEEILSRPMFESFNYLVADRSIAEKYPPGDAAAMLRGECLITNCEDTGPNSMEMLRQMLLREFGVVPERFAQTNSTNAQMLMVRACHGIAIVPDIVPEAREGSLVRIKMNMGEMIRYDMVRLASNSSPCRPGAHGIYVIWILSLPSTIECFSTASSDSKIWGRCFMA